MNNFRCQTTSYTYCLGTVKLVKNWE